MRNPAKREKPQKRSVFKAFWWRRGRDSNPCGVAPKRFSRPPRYDRFDTSPYMKLSFDRNHQLFNCFRNSFRNALLCCCRSAEKVRCSKAFPDSCDRYARKFSRPPRCDHFDKPAYEILLNTWAFEVARRRRIRFATFGGRRNKPAYFLKFVFRILASGEYLRQSRNIPAY